MNATNHAIVVCVERLRGQAAQARTDGQIVQSKVLEHAADELWRDRSAIAKETRDAFGHPAASNESPAP